jgi:hypothetical protein
MRLQIALEMDVIGDEKPEINVTPIDIPIPDDLAQKIKEAIALGDQFDVIPGDGELEESFRVKAPVRIWIINTSIDVKGTAVLRIKE